MVRQLPEADAAEKVQRGEEGACWGRHIPGWRLPGSERAFGDWKGGKPLFPQNLWNRVWATCVCVCLCVKVGHVSHCRAVSLKDCETGALSAVVYDSLMGCGTDREGSALGHHPRSTTCFSICRRCPAVHRAQARAGKRRKTTAGITCSGATPELCPEPTWDTAGNF